MGMVFPSSREEKCPRDDCASWHVERLGRAEFANLNLESSGGTLWLCVMCQRPFKLAAQSDIGGDPRVGPPVRTSSGGGSVHVTGRRSS
jgi:hypothetical protein